MPHVFTPITSGMYQKGAIQEGELAKKGRSPTREQNMGQPTSPPKPIARRRRQAKLA
jgi:hypothetical protein